MYAGNHGESMPKSQAKHEPVFQRALEFFAAVFEVIGLGPNALTAGNLPIILPFFQDLIFCEPHGVFNVGN